MAAQRRQVEELLRQLCAHLVKAGQATKALTTLREVREYLLGKIVSK